MHSPPAFESYTLHAYALRPFILEAGPDEGQQIRVADLARDQDAGRLVVSFSLKSHI